MTVKARMLKLLEQHENELISGEAAAAELNCTRAAIWKAVKSLREEGYTIEAGPNKGYVLRGGSRLSEEGIRLYLDHPDVPVKIYRELDSTNRAAKEAAFSGEAGHGALILARRQKSGRGRRGRSFYSPENAGLYMSIVLRPDRTLKEGLLITTAAATAVCRAVKKICGIDLGIKWVNDLYLHNKKVCGILTEAVTDFESGNIEFAVVGIGLNLYMPVLNDTLSVCKVTQFENLLRIWNKEKILEKTEKVHLPFHMDRISSDAYVEQLVWSELGDYIRELLRKERS